MIVNLGNQASDGFFLNMGSVLLALCQPLLHPNSAKLAKVDPRYCIALATVDTVAQEDTSVHLLGLQDQTKLCQPQAEGVQKTGFLVSS